MERKFRLKEKFYKLVIRLARLHDSKCCVMKKHVDRISITEMMSRWMAKIRKDKITHKEIRDNLREAPN